jgi:hypothetical protein
MITMARAPIPAEAEDTPRARLRSILQTGPATARELSQRAGIAEKEVLHHLEHLDRSLRARGEKLVVEPPTCLGCGFAFRERQRLAKPGSCPGCRGTRISPPRFSVS